MNFLLTWFLFISLYHLQVDALQCNSCSYDTFLNQTVCNTTIENCTPELKFCSTNMDERPDGSKTFTRGCVPSEVCKTDYCETYVINSLGRTSCNITCCQEDLCNRDGYILPGSYDSLPASCKDIWDKSSIRVDGSFYIRADSPSQDAHVFCHMTPIPGCGDGGWALVMKINGTKQTFTYHAAYWNNTIAYNEGGGTSLQEVEAKLSSYWSTPFTRICLGMKYENEENWIAIEHSSSSLWEVISNGTHTATNMTLTGWKSLLNNSEMWEGCTMQGFNSDMREHASSAKARIGIIGFLSGCVSSARSRIGFGTAGVWYSMDGENSCGNAYGTGSGMGNSKKAFGYIFVH